MKCLVFLLLFIPLNAQAELCSFKWNHDLKRTDGTFIDDSDLSFEVYIKGKKIKVDIDPTSRQLTWFGWGACPPCQDVTIRAIEDGKYSGYAQQRCPPTNPVICK